MQKGKLTLLIACMSLALVAGIAAVKVSRRPYEKEKAKLIESVNGLADDVADIERGTSALPEREMLEHGDEGFVEEGEIEVVPQLVPHVMDRIDLADNQMLTLRVAVETAGGLRHFNVGDTCHVTGGHITVVANDETVAIVQHMIGGVTQAALDPCPPHALLFFTAIDNVHQLVHVPDTTDELREAADRLLHPAR